MVSKRDLKTLNAVLVVLFWIFMGTGFFYMVEDWTLIDSFYFSVSTLTTVGYGDITPTSQFSRLFTALYILFGVGIVLASLGIVGREFLQKEEAKLRHKYAHTAHQQHDEVESEIDAVKKMVRKTSRELKETEKTIESDEKKIASVTRKTNKIVNEETPKSVKKNTGKKVIKKSAKKVVKKSTKKKTSTKK